MGLGTPLFGGLLRSNAVVRIEVASVSTSGGTVATWPTLRSGVDVLITQVESDRDLNNEVMMDRVRCSLAGKEPYLARPDVRFYVTATVPGLEALVGRYLSATNPNGFHSRAVGGLLKARINLRCEVQFVPGNDGAEL